MTDKEKIMKPDCHKCKYRNSIPGDAHSRCRHPNIGNRDDPLSSIIGVLASVGRVVSIGDESNKEDLNIKLHPHGVKMGWANWPLNFDPVWLESCDGFEIKDEDGDN